jgi:hypothetical protein
MEHSGLHSMYGLPWRPGRHVQVADPPIRPLHSALIPHGVGLQGFCGGRGVAKNNAKLYINQNNIEILSKLNHLSYLFIFNEKLTCWSITSRERISNIALITDTNRNMIPN